MRLVWTVLAGLLVAIPAHSAEHPLQGNWQLRSSQAPDFVAVLLVDSEGRATYASPHDASRQDRYVGYASDLNERAVRFKLTDGKAVANMDCVRQSGELMHCFITRASGYKTSVFALVRVGPGPRKLN